MRISRKKLGIAFFTAAAFAWLSVSAAHTAADTKVIQELADWAMAEGRPNVIDSGLWVRLGLPAGDGAPVPTRQKSFYKDSKKGSLVTLAVVSVEGRTHLVLVQREPTYIIVWRMDSTGKILRTIRSEGEKGYPAPDNELQRFDEAVNFLYKIKFQAGCSASSGIDRDIQIGTCTRAIQSGRWQGKDLAWAFHNRGYAYKDKNDYDRAIQDYDQALKLDPNYAYAFNNRGWAYYKKGQYERAIQDYDQAIKLDPDAGFATRGLVYSAMGQYERAIQDFDHAIKFDPKSAFSLYGRGLTKLKKGDSAGGNADIAAAKLIKIDIAEYYEKIGVK